MTLSLTIRHINWVALFKHLKYQSWLLGANSWRDIPMWKRSKNQWFVLKIIIVRGSGVLDLWNAQLFVWFHDISISLLDNLFVVNMKQDLKVASTYQVLIIFTKISIENYNRAVYSAWFYKEILILYLSLFYSRTFLIDWNGAIMKQSVFCFVIGLLQKNLFTWKRV